MALCNKNKAGFTLTTTKKCFNMQNICVIFQRNVKRYSTTTRQNMNL